MVFNTVYSEVYEQFGDIQSGFKSHSKFIFLAPDLT